MPNRIHNKAPYYLQSPTSSFILLSSFILIVLFFPCQVKSCHYWYKTTESIVPASSQFNKNTSSHIASYKGYIMSVEVIGDKTTILTPSSRDSESTTNDCKNTFISSEAVNSISQPQDLNNQESYAQSSMCLDASCNLAKVAGIAKLLREEATYEIDNPLNTKKREGYLLWNEYFMCLAFLTAQRSKDPNMQTGACIVDQDKRVIGVGYNGFPRGCSDDCLPWAASVENGDRTRNILHTRDPYMCHAEINAILNKCSTDVKGAQMYVPYFPSA